MSPRFDDALRGYLEIVKVALSNELLDAGQAIVIRDLRGRLRLAIEKRPQDEKALSNLQPKLDEAAGRFAGGKVLVREELLAPEAVFGAADQYLDRDSGVYVLERTMMGADWTRSPLPNAQPQTPRATLYGIKGGVGRSLALSAWAWHLATLGKRVLVVDLDLESPGVSSMLLPPDPVTDFGVIDWFVEGAVGGADSDLVQLMVAPSPLAEGTSGSILVAPCSGRRSSDQPSNDSYLAKLSRAYLDLPQVGGSFAERLAGLIDALETKYKPQVVLLDSRAGLHDIAAVAITRLSATAFLFAQGTRQTWDGYRKLLNLWSKQPQVGKYIRDRLHMVAAQVPETERDEYLRNFELDAYNLFDETLYEEAGPERPDAYNFDIRAEDAPHYRLPIYWSLALQSWNPLTNTVTPDQLKAALGEFLKRATELLLGSPLTEDKGLDPSEGTA
jgi:hypothetical protein